MPPTRRAGALALALLLVLAPLAQAAAEPYEVVWSEQRSEVASEGALGLGEARTLKVAVDQENLTYVEFLLTWTETGDEFQVTREDTFRLTVTDPEGNNVPAGPVQGATGLLVVETPTLNRMPRGMTLQAESTEEARAALKPQASAKGTGTWRVTVELLDTGNPAGTTVDQGNAFVLTVVLHHYEAGVFRVVSLGPPPGKSLLQSVDGEQAPWLWATVGLAAMSVLLGGLIVADRAGWLRRGKGPE